MEQLYKSYLLGDKTLSDKKHPDFLKIPSYEIIDPYNKIFPIDVPFIKFDGDKDEFDFSYPDEIKLLTGNFEKVVTKGNCLLGSIVFKTSHSFIVYIESSDTIRIFDPYYCWKKKFQLKFESKLSESFSQCDRDRLHIIYPNKSDAVQRSGLPRGCQYYVLCYGMNRYRGKTHEEAIEFMRDKSTFLQWIIDKIAKKNGFIEENVKS